MQVGLRVSGRPTHTKPTDADFLAVLLDLLDQAGGHEISRTYHRVMARAEGLRLHRGRRRVDPEEITICDDPLE